MLLVKKLIRRPPPVAGLLSLAPPSHDPPPPGNDFYMKDEQIKTNFLVDTGYCHSIHPTNTLEKHHSKDIGIHLITANGSTITTYETKTFHLTFSGHRFSWTFVLADVRVPLLGTDFLSRFQLLIDVTHSRLLNILSYLSTPLQPTATPSDVAVATAPSKFQQLQVEYPKVFQPELQFPHVSLKHGIYHHIKTSSPPVHAHLFPQLAITPTNSTYEPS